jgi:hypothetical protein
MQTPRELNHPANITTAILLFRQNLATSIKAFEIIQANKLGLTECKG